MEKSDIDHFFIGKGINHTELQHEIKDNLTNYFCEMSSTKSDEIKLILVVDRYTEILTKLFSDIAEEFNNRNSNP